jgi:hypothetical protein
MKNIETLKKIVSQQPKSSGIYKMVNRSREDSLCRKSKKYSK